MAWHDGVRRLHHDEFVSWQSAKSLASVKVNQAENVVARLKAGELEGAANASWLDGAARMSTGPLVLAPGWWSGVDGGHPIHYANLWKTGAITLFVPDLKNKSISQVTFSGVRIKIGDMEAAIAPLPPKEKTTLLSDLKRDPLLRELQAKLAVFEAELPRINVPAQSSRDNPVSTSEIDEWHAALSPEDRELSLRTLLAKAQQHFYPRRVVRKLIEPFARGRPTGRKPIKK